MGTGFESAVLRTVAAFQRRNWTTRDAPMNLPLALLVTTDSDFAIELQLELKAACESVVIQRPDRVLELMAEHKAAAVVIDVRQSLHGGHAVDRLLEELEAASSTSEVILLADLFCPEVIERRAATSGIAIVRSSPQSLVELADQVRVRLPKPELVKAAPVNSIAAGFETSSPQVRRMLDDLAIAATHDVTILLIGETGSGKTYLS